jgi:hypothetical protein
MLRITVLLAATAMTALAPPARAAYIMSPAGPTDTRMSFVPPMAAVFVVDSAKGQIAMCCPDNKDNKIQVVCTPATKLP